MKYNKKTKIVATLGPSTDEKSILLGMIKAGVDVFRINFSHANHKVVTKHIQWIKDLNRAYSFKTTILADLQGPKLRIGEVEEGVELFKGDEITFITGEEFIGNKQRIYMNYEKFCKDVKPGENILLDDGKLIFKIIETNLKDSARASVVQGGVLKSKKGVNLPKTKISLPALTKQDIENAIFAMQHSVDWFALSFVRHADDIKDLQSLIEKHNSHKIPIIAKIEKPEAVKNIDEIMAHCDGIMVARGDLGVEIPVQKVPLIQKKLVLQAKRCRIPVIIATQMMESMISSLIPSRAEVNDVANSVMDGADAVMLSGETSIGNYPVEVIENMSSIIETVENSEIIKVPQTPPHIKTKRYITKSICYHAATMANEIDAKVISTLTNSGYTAFQISAWRPNTHILVYTSNKYLLTQLNLLWGVKAFYYDKLVSTDETLKDISKMAVENNFISIGEMSISLVAMPVDEKGMVNTLRVEKIK